MGSFQLLTCHYAIGATRQRFAPAHLRAILLKCLSQGDVQIMFSSARQKVARAKKQIFEIDDILEGHFANAGCQLVCERGPDSRYSVRIIANIEMPEVCSVIIGDVVHNLRSALEHVASDLIAAKEGNNARSGSMFPMGEKMIELENYVKNNKLTALYPEFADIVLNQIRPSKEGNRVLWACGKLWNIDKHRLPIVSVAVTYVENLRFRDERNNVITASAEVIEGKIIKLAKLSTPIKIIDNGRMHFCAYLDEADVLEHESLFDVLMHMHDEVQKSIDLLEPLMTKYN